MNLRQNYSIGNRLVRASVLAPDQKLHSLLPARHLVHVDLRYAVSTGEILSEHGKPKYLLIYHHTNKYAQVFMALSLTKEVEVTRFYQGINAATNMASGQFTEEKFKAWVMKESGDPLSIQGMLTDKVTYYSGTPLKVSDEVEGRRINVVKVIAGIYVAEAA